MARINPGVKRPHPAAQRTLQGMDLERLLRQRPTSDPLNRGLADSPRAQFEMDDSDNLETRDDGAHAAFHYGVGKLRVQRRQIPFVMKGVLAVDHTGQLDIEYSGILTKLRFRVKVAPVGSSVVGHVELNTVSIATLSLPAGAFWAETTITTRVHVLCPDDAALILPTPPPPDVLEVFVDSVDGTSADLVGCIVV